MNELRLFFKYPYEYIWYHVLFFLPPEERRPFTFIMRDFYHKSPFICIGVIVWILWAITLFHQVTWQELVLVGVGVIVGHLFFGKDYVAGEQEYPPFNPDKEKGDE